jgi:hypothetical protein
LLFRFSSLRIADLCEKKNMLKVLVTIEAMARHAHRNGYPIAWRENDKRNFSMEELQKAESDYQPSLVRRSLGQAQEGGAAGRCASAGVCCAGQKMMTAAVGADGGAWHWRWCWR